MSAGAVAAYIGAAYWFTASTSFANPAASFGRMFSDSFAGIAPASVPGFVLAQLAGVPVERIAALSLAFVPLFVLLIGGGSNLLVDDEPFEGTVVLVRTRGIERLPAPEGRVRLRVEGAEHVPTTGPVIIASNHLSFIDSLVIPLAAGRKVGFLGKAVQDRKLRKTYLALVGGGAPHARLGGGHSLPRSLSVSRRSRLVGRPAPRSRCGMDSTISRGGGGGLLSM